VCRASPPFHSRPVLYTRYYLARDCLEIKRDRVPFVIARVQADKDPEEVCRSIQERTGLLALTREQCMWMTAWYNIRHTAIVPNFAITIALGFLVGAAISGQLFHLFVRDHLPHFGLLMAMGAKGRTVVRMVLLQTAVVSFLGLCLGLGSTALFFLLTGGTTTLAGLCLYWQAAAVTAAAVLLFMAAVGMLAVRRILRQEPAAVFTH
jgi:putative ABC transport system permease protein